MRIGVYVDGYNLYYGARDFCTRGTAGWRWLDLRALANQLIAGNPGWVAAGAHLERLVYCTARISARSNPQGHVDQDTYLAALKDGQIVDHIEFGVYVERVKQAPLALKDRKGRPVIVTSKWPVMVQDASGTPVPDAHFMVSIARREEKGTDVNVASHLLLDVLDGHIDAAIVICNDSDLEFPLRVARGRLPVGLVNPSPDYLAGRLKGAATDGVGGHWWLQLSAADFRANQLPDPCAGHPKPPPW